MGPASFQTGSPVESVPFWISKLIDSFCSLLLWLLVIVDDDGADSTDSLPIAYAVVRILMAPSTGFWPIHFGDGRGSLERN